MAGLGPVGDVEGVENYDLSMLVNAHDEYPRKIDEIFTKFKFY